MSDSRGREPYDRISARREAKQKIEEEFYLDEELADEEAEEISDDWVGED